MKQIDPEQESYLDFKQDSLNKVEALIAKVKVMEIPELFNGGMSREEEEAIFAKVGYKKSNLKIVVGRGTICRCNHGKSKHAFVHGGWHSRGAGACSLKTCKCNRFIQKVKY